MIAYISIDFGFSREDVISIVAGNMESGCCRIDIYLYIDMKYVR